MTLQDPATSEMDFWFCLDSKVAHDFLYRGKNNGYRCRLCGFACSKEQLKAATDA